MDFEDEALQALLEAAASVLVVAEVPERKESEENGIHKQQGERPLEQKAL